MKNHTIVNSTREVKTPEFIGYFVGGSALLLGLIYFITILADRLIWLHK